MNQNLPALSKPQRLGITGFAAGIVSVIGAVLITKPSWPAGEIPMQELVVTAVMLGAGMLFAYLVISVAMRMLRR